MNSAHDGFEIVLRFVAGPVLVKNGQAFDVTFAHTDFRFSVGHLLRRLLAAFGPSRIFRSQVRKPGVFVHGAIWIDVFIVSEVAAGAHNVSVV